MTTLICRWIVANQTQRNSINIFVFFFFEFSVVFIRHSEIEMIKDLDQQLCCEKKTVVPLIRNVSKYGDAVDKHQFDEKKKKNHNSELIWIQSVSKYSPIHHTFVGVFFWAICGDDYCALHASLRPLFLLFFFLCFHVSEFWNHWEWVRRR